MVDAALASDPYCGPPPVPGELAGRWNLDPVLLGALAAIAVLYAIGAWRAGRALGARERLTFAGGWLGGALVFTSPLCALGVSLFAAREAQHLLLVLVAAPLAQIGRLDLALRALAPRGLARRESRPGAAHALTAALLFTAVLWGWHVPAAYAATFDSSAVYWAMHSSLLASALALWTALLRSRAALRSAVGVGTALQMALLGSLLSFAPDPLYAPHATATALWGLSALEDQQLAGLLCWIPSSAVLLAALLVSTASLLRDTPPRAWT